MRNEIVGFVGNDCFDLPFYLSSVAVALGEPGLFVDLSGEGVAVDLSHMGEVLHSGPADAHGVPVVTSMDGIRKYRRVFVYFGRNRPKKSGCSKLYVVTDGLPSDVRRLKAIPEGCAPSRSVIVRSDLSVGKYRKTIEVDLAHLISDGSCHVMGFSQSDREDRMALLCSGASAARRVPAGMAGFVQGFFKGDFKPAEVRRALKALHNKRRWGDGDT